MGFLKKAQQAFTQGIDPAIVGGPSNRSWRPTTRSGSRSTASPFRTMRSRRDAQARGINNEAGMITLAEERGWNPADTKAAFDGWVQRMGQSQAVGQQFRTLLGY